MATDPVERVSYSVIIEINLNFFHKVVLQHKVGTLAVDGWTVTFGTARR